MISNRKKNIAIVGAGNAGCITALHYYLEAPNEIDKITIYHHPDHPIEKVGQGSTGSGSLLVNNFFHLNFQDQNIVQSTRKEGIMYEGWGKLKDKFFHSFPQSNTSIHYIPNLLSKAVLESGVFDVVEKKITDPESEIDCDFIFDCRGRNNRDPDLYDKIINPLNSVILATKDEIIPDLFYTRTVATPNGWTFVIPNVGATSYGYLYNNTITTKEEATADFIERFDVVPSSFIDFDNYVAKSFFSGDRTILNGNRATFIEPLEASSAGTYEDIARITQGYITLGLDSKENCDLLIRKEISRVETFLLWHYQFGSKYDTPFWEYTKSLPFNPDSEFKGVFDYCVNNSYHDIVRKTCRERNPVNSMYSQWNAWSFRNWVDGIGIDKTHKIL